MIISNIRRLIGVDPDRRSSALRGAEMSQAGIVENAWLRIAGSRFVDWGTMDSFPETDGSEEIVDAQGGDVLPSFCDSHTHIV